MKHFRIRGLTALLLAACVLLCALPVKAAGGTPTVIFDAATGTFDFQNAAVYPGNECPDLFPNFKELMPGDVREQPIRVEVRNAGKNTVKLYLRAELPEGERFDNYARLFDVSKTSSDGRPMAQLFVQFDGLSATPKRLVRRVAEWMGLREPQLVTYTEAVGEPLYLGAYTGKSRGRDAVVQLELDIEAGNEYHGLTAQVDWAFIAEIYEEDKPDKPEPVPGPEPQPGEGLPVFERVLHQAYLIGYPDGTVRPNGNITRAETAAVFFRLFSEESRQFFWCTTNPFTDVPAAAWYNNEISTLFAAGTVEGYPDGTFRPNDPITRAEFVTMFTRMERFEPMKEMIFPDVAGHWAESAINRAASEGYLKGYPDGTFRPDRFITRAEVATIMNRLLGHYPHLHGLLEDMLHWPDNADEAAWYYEDIQEATNSHGYYFWRDERTRIREDWTSLTETIDWTQYEKYMEAERIYRSSTILK